MAAPYWRLSTFYFCYFAILGAFLPFWSLYLKQTGFSADEIGQLTALTIVTKILVPNLWGWLADWSGKRLKLIRIATFLSAASFAGILVRHDFIWFAWVGLVFSFFWNSSIPQFEAVTLFYLRSESHRYSRIRLWGSVGFIGAVLGIGRFLDDFSIDYLPHIILSILVCNWLVAQTIPEVRMRKTNRGRTGIVQVLKNGEVIAFFVVYMLLQIAHGPYYVFYSVYLVQHGYSAAVTGLLWALGVAAEILLFMSVGFLLKCFSIRALLLSSLALSVLRWLMIAHGADSLAIVATAQLLHAASFASAHVVAILLIYRFFGEQHQGKGQAFYTSICFGLGGMLGSLYCGYFWEALGGSQIFALAGLSSGLGLLIAFFAIGRGEMNACNSTLKPK